MSTAAIHEDSKESGTASAVRALQLLNVFSGEEPSLGVSEISRRAGIPTSTAHRLLSHLVKGGLLTKDGSNYRLSLNLYQLGNQAMHGQVQGLREAAAPYLGELFGRTGLTANLAFLQGPEIVMIDKVVGLRGYRSPSVVGGRYPTACTALGKAMLAFEPQESIQNVLTFGIPRRTRHSISSIPEMLGQLAQTRTTRLAYDREEASLGQFCVASPIVVNERAVAAISLSGKVNSYDVAATGALLVQSANQLAAKLNARRNPRRVSL